MEVHFQVDGMLPVQLPQPCVKRISVRWAVGPHPHRRFARIVGNAAETCPVIPVTGIFSVRGGNLHFVAVPPGAVSELGVSTPVNTLAR